MVSSGLGVTLLPRMALETLTKDETIRLLNFKNTPPSRRVVLVWRRSFARYEAIKKIKELIMTVDLSDCKNHIKKICLIHYYKQLETLH